LVKVNGTRFILVAGLVGVVGALLWAGNTPVQIEDETISLDDIIVNGVKRYIGSPILSGIATVTGAKIARGHRNNNPGNIRFIANNPFQGQIGNDGGYGIYDTMANGVRALARTLDTYRTKYHLVTVSAIINRWAPPVENNTASYVNAVSSALGVGANELINTLDPAVMRPLIRAITVHENGYDFLTADEINSGIFAARNS
jgi:hypothetical protein